MFKPQKVSKPLVLVVLASMLLAACGGEVATSTPIPPTVTAVVEVATATTAAAAPTDTVAAAAPTNTTAAAAATDTPAGAAATATTKPVASKEGTLTFWVDSGRSKAIQDLGAKFTAKYNVPVTVQELGFGDIRDQLKIAGPAGEGPDIIIGAHDWLGELVTNGVLEPMDLGAKASSFDPVSLKAFTYNGKLYGVPYAVEAIALMYNKDYVPTPPKTWDELKQIAKKLQDDKKVEQGYVIQSGPSDPYHSYPIFTGFGGYVFGRTADGSYNPQDVGLDSAGGKAAMEEMHQMVVDGLIKPGVSGDVMNSLFQTGKSAMMFTGPWALNDTRKAKINYGVAKIPTMKGTARPFVGVQGFMVNSFGKNKLLAQTFLTEFVATDEAMQSLYDAVPNGPAWLPMRDKVTDPDLKVFAESAADGDPLPAIPQMSAVWEAWTKALDVNFQGQEPPDKAIEDAGKTIRAKIAGSK
jgi:maltose-binding protein MalE